MAVERRGLARLWNAIMTNMARRGQKTQNRGAVLLPFLSTGGSIPTPRSRPPAIPPHVYVARRRRRHFFFYLARFQKYGTQTRRMNCPRSTNNLGDLCACKIRLYHCVFYTPTSMHNEPRRVKLHRVSALPFQEANMFFIFERIPVSLQPTVILCRI